jgi:hypothetical protein
MSNSTRTDTLIMQAIRGVKRYRRGSAKTRHNHIKTRHNHIKEARRFVYTIRQLGYGVQRWKNLSNKHVHQAVNKWQQEESAKKNAGRPVTDVAMLMPRIVTRRSPGLKRRVNLNLKKNIEKMP